jgi:hypothetical protein
VGKQEELERQEELAVQVQQEVLELLEVAEHKEALAE